MTNMNLSEITVKQWSKLLLERGITHNSSPDSLPQIISTRLELQYPEFEFGNLYRLMRLFGLSPDQKSILLKMMHNLLPNKE